MREKEEELARLGLRIVIVSFEAGFLARQYITQTKLDWPLLVDENRELYRAYGMLRANLLDVWGPRVWLAYLKELARGARPKASSADVYQRGGDVLIDPAGIVRLHHVGAGPADRPTVDTIIQEIEKIQKNQVT